MTASAHVFVVDGITYHPPRLPDEWHLRRPMFQLLNDFTEGDGWQWTPGTTGCEVCWMRRGTARRCSGYHGAPTLDGEI